MLDLTNQQEQVIKNILKGKSTRVLGEAGSGKSFVVDIAIEVAKREGHKVLHSAATGNAADNGRAKYGTTNHLTGIEVGSKKYLPSGVITSGSRRKSVDEIIDGNATVQSRMKTKKGQLLWVVVDEAEAMNAEDLFLVYQVVTGLNSNARFLLAGDPAQLPPVKGNRPNLQPEYKLQQGEHINPTTHYFSSMGYEYDDEYDKILAPCPHEAMGVETIYLTHSIRQMDEKFRYDLFLVRNGFGFGPPLYNRWKASQQEGVPNNVVNYFHNNDPCFQSKEELLKEKKANGAKTKSFKATVNLNTSYITVNKQKYTLSLQGKSKKDKIVTEEGSTFHLTELDSIRKIRVPFKMEIFLGERMVITENLKPGDVKDIEYSDEALKDYALIAGNGTNVVIEEFVNNYSVKVRKLIDGTTFVLPKMKLRHDNDYDVKFEQLPLLPAQKAITIHRSQGRTETPSWEDPENPYLYDGVGVNLWEKSGKGVRPLKTPGAAYVALSRVKDINQIWFPLYNQDKKKTWDLIWSSIRNTEGNDNAYILEAESEGCIHLLEDSVEFTEDEQGEYFYCEFTVTEYPKWSRKKGDLLPAKRYDVGLALDSEDLQNREVTVLESVYFDEEDNPLEWDIKATCWMKPAKQLLLDWFDDNLGEDDEDSNPDPDNPDEGDNDSPDGEKDLDLVKDGSMTLMFPEDSDTPEVILNGEKVKYNEVACEDGVTFLANHDKEDFVLFVHDSSDFGSSLGGKVTKETVLDEDYIPEWGITVHKGQTVICEDINYPEQTGSPITVMFGEVISIREEDIPPQYCTAEELDEEQLELYQLWWGHSPSENDEETYYESLRQRTFEGDVMDPEEEELIDTIVIKLLDIANSLLLRRSTTGHKVEITMDGEKCDSLFIDGEFVTDSFTYVVGREEGAAFIEFGEDKPRLITNCQEFFDIGNMDTTMIREESYQELLNIIPMQGTIREVVNTSSKSVKDMTVQEILDLNETREGERITQDFYDSAPLEVKEVIDYWKGECAKLAKEIENWALEQLQYVEQVKEHVKKECVKQFGEKADVDTDVSETLSTLFRYNEDSNVKLWFAMNSPIASPHMKSPTINLEEVAPWCALDFHDTEEFLKWWENPKELLPNGEWLFSREVPTFTKEWCTWSHNIENYWEPRLVDCVTLYKGISVIKDYTEAIDIPTHLQHHKEADTEDIYGELNLFEDSNVVADGVNISSNTKGIGGALTNPTTKSKKKGNINYDYPVIFRGEYYSDAEEAYQANKKSVKDEDKQALMVEIIKAKLCYNPDLVEGIDEHGGVAWLERCSHKIAGKAWEGEGRESTFIQALITAYENLPNPFYAGVGSRETPKEVQSKMTEIAEDLSKDGYILRSGGAKGADKAFEKGSEDSQIFYVKDDGYKDGDSIKSYDSNLWKKAEEIMESVHPNVQALKNKGIYCYNLQVRNVFQILGEDLSSPAEFVICWTPKGKKKGGTATAISLAEKFDIDVFNLAVEDFSF